MQMHQEGTDLALDQRRVVLIAGAVAGALSFVLVAAGNPANMGICVACFIRDTAGGLGLHRAEVVQYLRPEIPGFILGSMLAAWLRAIQGAAGLRRCSGCLGFFVMIGAGLPGLSSQDGPSPAAGISTPSWAYWALRRAYGLASSSCGAASHLAGARVWA